MQQEVRNYWRALEWIEEQLEDHRPVSEDFVLELHCILLVRGHGRRGQKSKYRTEECPVVDSVTRQIDYGPPEPKDIQEMMHDLINWLNNCATKALPGPIRAGLFAHRFVSIHPFSDGNGRTARALATTELWRSGYEMKGFLSLEEYYTRDISAYYNNLQMGLPVDFYEGRNDTDHTQWLEYFISTMAQAAGELHTAAKHLYEQNGKITPPWEELTRVQQQLLMRLTLRFQNYGSDNAAMEFRPSDIVEWFCVSSSTAHDWLVKWRDQGFVQPLKSETQRVRSYLLTETWAKIVQLSIDNASIKHG
jgi:Fic family protein